MSDDDYDNGNISDTEEVNPRAHRQLVDGVAKLHKTQHIRKAVRTEAAIKRSEFHLAKTTVDDAPVKRDSKVNVRDLVTVLDQTKKHAAIGKKLKKTEAKNKVLNKPLERPSADRLKRAIGYEKTKEKLMRWDAIVAKNRSSDHMHYPLNQDLVDVQVIDAAPTLADIRVKSDLLEAFKAMEPEIFHVAKTIDEEEEEIRQKLTRAEMIERSRELRRLRVKESQQSAKAHRQNKIKSKKFHRILKKERLKQQIKEFELLQKTDPEAALRKIEQLDKNRVEERASLRHRNTGTWAKNLQVRAKYDKEVRKELSDQIAISRELTAKKPIDESDDENEENAYNPEDDPDYDPFNPWLKSGSTEKSEEMDEVFGGYRKYWAERSTNAENLKKYRGETATKNGERTIDPAPAGGVTIKQVKTSEKSEKAKPKLSKVNKGWIEEDVDGSTEPVTIKVAKKQKKSKVVDNLDDLFDDAEDELNAKFTKKSEGIMADLKRTSADKRKAKKTSNGHSGEIDLSFKKQIKRPKIDEALITENADEEEEAMVDVIKKASKKVDPAKNIANAKNDTDNINPDDFAKVKPKHLQTALPDTIYTNDDDGFYEHDDADYENSDAKRLTLAEAFEDDDIVAQFEREKEEEAKKNGPQEIDLSLPGWGSWGGSGIDPAKQKAKRRMVLKFPATQQRKPENKGNVVIIENGDEKLKKHRVADLPFPFTSVADYEQSIRLPLGQDFVPATAHKVLVRPAVTTTKGAIIKPMSEDMLVKPVRRPYTRTGKKIAELEKDLF